jgi:epoxyqueuosine reductase
MPKEFRKLIRSTIYGCDICQLVCPFNKGKDFHFHREMEPSLKDVYPLLKPLLTITNKEFQRRFGKMSAAWRGKKPLQRNAVIALANHHDTSAVVDLCRVIKSHPVAMIRGTAAWSIFKLVPKPSDELKQFMVSALNKETDEKAKQEFQEVLEKWKN